MKRKKPKVKKAPQLHPRGSVTPGDEPDLHSPARPQDEFNPRAKGTRHRKVTADKWNQ